MRAQFIVLGCVLGAVIGCQENSEKFIIVDTNRASAVEETGYFGNGGGLTRAMQGVWQISDNDITRDCRNRGAAGACIAENSKKYEVEVRKDYARRVFVVIADETIQGVCKRYITEMKEHEVRTDILEGVPYAMLYWDLKKGDLNGSQQGVPCAANDSMKPVRPNVVLEQRIPATQVDNPGPIILPFFKKALARGGRAIVSSDYAEWTSWREPLVQMGALSPQEGMDSFNFGGSSFVIWGTEAVEVAFPVMDLDRMELKGVMIKDLALRAPGGQPTIPGWFVGRHFSVKAVPMERLRDPHLHRALANSISVRGELSDERVAGREKDYEQDIYSVHNLTQSALLKLDVRTQNAIKSARFEFVKLMLQKLKGRTSNDAGPGARP